MTQLVLGLDNFYEAYQYFPGASDHANDSTLKTAENNGSMMMAALLGLQSAEDQNPRGLAFFKTKTAENKKDGLERTGNKANLYDPWGNPYFVYLNYDNDNQIHPPGIEEILFDRRSVAWSLGPDGKSGTPETDKDNVYSWNR